MLILGIETSCDETGVALVESRRGLLSHALHSQGVMHEEYGGVVPELASRDHIRRVLPLIRKVMVDADCTLTELDGIAYTEGPGLSGALLVGASVAAALGFALKVPTIGIHHLEGHLLAPLLEPHPPEFPFVALLVSGGHSQLMRVSGVGEYEILGETLDDAAGEAFDKTAKLLGLGYPGGPALSQRADAGVAGRFKLPRPMLHSKDLNFSFSGLKTAVLSLSSRQTLDVQTIADIARAFQDAIVEVLTTKSLAALRQTGLARLVIAGGVGANRQLREQVEALSVQEGFAVFYPKLEFCTDNGAMIALAGAMRLARFGQPHFSAFDFGVRPRWDMRSL